MRQGLVAFVTMTGLALGASAHAQEPEGEESQDTTPPAETVEETAEELNEEAAEQAPVGVPRADAYQAAPETQEEEAQDEDAQDGDDGERPAELGAVPATDERVVTTARAPMPQLTTDRSVNVVDESDIQRRQAKSITEALEEEPGILIQSTNRGAGTLILRGLVGPENLIYFDGVRFNQSTFRTGPNQYLNTIDPWALRRIEVVRGPGSVLYGSGAMGGVVQMFPHRIPQAPHLQVIGAAESAASTVGTHVQTGTQVGDLGALVGGSFKRHGMIRVGDNGNLFVTGIEDDIFLAQGFEEFHGQAQVGYDLTDDMTLRANYFTGFVQDAMRMDRVGDGEVRVYDNEDHLAYLTYEYDGLDYLDELRVNVSYHRTHENVARANCRTVLTEGPDGQQLERVTSVSSCIARDDATVMRRRINIDDVDTIGTSFTGITDLLDARLRVTWGGDAYFDFVSSSRSDATAPDFEFEPRDRGNFSDGSRHSTVGLFTHAQYALYQTGRHGIVTNAGARVENFSAFAPDVTEEIGDVDYGFTGIVGTAGISYLYDTTLNTYFNWSQGYRAPNLQESTVLGDTGNFFEVPNPELGPERSDTFELGSKVDFPRLVRLQPALFVSLLSNRITREPTTFEGQSEIDGKQVRHRVNRDRAYFYGAEFSAATAPLAGISFYGNLTWMDGAVAADEEDPNFEEGPLHDLFASSDAYENPRRLPPLLYLAGVRYEPAGNWYVGFWFQGSGAQDKLSSGDRRDQRICEKDVGVLYGDIDEDCPGSKAWVTFNARTGYRYELMRFDLAFENLGDQRYRRHGSGVPAPGFNVLGQLTLEY